MRYYIYLDRDFLTTIFSTITEIDFDIEIMEYSIKKSFTTNDGINVDPHFENMRKDSCEKKVEEKDEYCRREEENIDRKKVGFCYDHGNSYNVQTEKKYINIEDITSIKNRGFYHNLIEKIKNTTGNLNRNGKYDRIIEEEGIVKLSNRSDLELDEFFLVNDTYIWHDKENLDMSLEVISKMQCSVHILGYRMNCNSETKILRAIAMYIE